VFVAHYPQISQIERGDSGGSEHSAKAIAAALGLTIDDIWLDRKKQASHHSRRAL
jgi:DNA-binding XRE family transcriptional regulator